MPALPPAMLHLLTPFAPLFARRVWGHALVLIAGALLTPGRRTVGAALRVWYHPGLPPVPTRRVLVRDPQGRFEPQALLCTDLAADPAQILAWFVLRWRPEVTFEAARRHLGVERRCQWSDRAIRRTTPALFGLFSLVALYAHPRMRPTGDLVKVPRALVERFSGALCYAA